VYSGPEEAILYLCEKKLELNRKRFVEEFNNENRFDLSVIQF